VTVRRFLWWTTLSSFGSGLVLPMTALFLVNRTSLGAGGTAAYFAVSAVTELLTSSALTTMRTRLSPGLLAGGGYFTRAVGYGLLGVLPGLVSVLLVAVVVGVGRGTSAGGVPAFLRQTVTGDELRDVFARRYRALNVGLGLGLLAATVALSLAPPSVLPVLFVANGATFVPLAVFLLRRPMAPVDGPAAEAAATLGLDRLIRLAGAICVVDFCVFAFTYSQLDSAVPLATTRLDKAAIGFVSAVVAVNTVAVVVLQGPVSRLLARWSPGRGMQVAMGAWLAGYAAALATSVRPGLVSWAGLVLLAVLFAGGEAAYASSYQPWLLAAVPQAESTRASSMANVCSSLGLSIGPSLGVLLVATGHAAVVWAGLAAACLLTLGLVTLIVRIRTTPVVERDTVV
jgi:hypothetical protein